MRASARAGLTVWVTSPVLVGGLWQGNEIEPDDDSDDLDECAYGRMRR